MSIPITDKFKPKGTGGYALIDAADVEMPDGTRLSDFKGGVTSVNGQTGDVNITVTNGKDGKDGTNGKDGAPGANGKDGVSPSVTIEAITGGHRITITDASGTKTFDVMDGVDGEDGQDGQNGSDATVTVDSALDPTSTNPVQNKVITALVNSIVNQLLPVVSPADNGKILQVANGAWSAVALENSAVKTYIDDYINEALGGDY